MYNEKFVSVSTFYQQSYYTYLNWTRCWRFRSAGRWHVGLYLTHSANWILLSDKWHTDINVLKTKDTHLKDFMIFDIQSHTTKTNLTPCDAFEVWLISTVQLIYMSSRLTSRPVKYSNLQRNHSKNTCSATPRQQRRISSFLHRASMINKHFIIQLMHNI